MSIRSCATHAGRPASIGSPAKGRICTRGFRLPPNWRLWFYWLRADDADFGPAWTIRKLVYIVQGTYLLWFFGALRLSRAQIGNHAANLAR